MDNNTVEIEVGRETHDVEITIENEYDVLEVLMAIAEKSTNLDREEVESLSYQNIKTIVEGVNEVLADG